MALTDAWRPTEPDVAAALAAHRQPLAAMALTQVPAVILRQAYKPEDCQALLARLAQRGLMPEAPPEGRTRVDVGTSLGNKGSDKEDFLAHAAQTHALFAGLFEGLVDPVEVMYDNLAAIAPGKRVMTAREADGRLYGPAIFRIHYTQHAYRPHIDHVVLREKRFNYAVSRFRQQYAGVLCLQNADDAGPAPQAVLHRCLWTPQVQTHLAAGTYGEYAQERGIEQCRVELEAGDLYFFNTRCIHEVPAVPGDRARVVLAVFIGYNAEDSEVYVWS